MAVPLDRCLFRKLIKSFRVHTEKIADHDYALKDFKESIIFLNAKLLDFGGTATIIGCGNLLTTAIQELLF